MDFDFVGGENKETGFYSGGRSSFIKATRESKLYQKITKPPST